MTRFNKIQKITMVALIIAMLFNPMSYQVLKDYIELVFTWVAIVAGIWCAGVLVFYTFKLDKVNIPAKTKKTKPQKYLEA